MLGERIPPDQLARYVLLASDVYHQQERLEATRVLDGLLASPEGPRAFLDLLRYSNSNNNNSSNNSAALNASIQQSEQVLFYALTALQHLLQAHHNNINETGAASTSTTGIMDLESRIELRKLLLKEPLCWMSIKTPAATTKPITAAASGTANIGGSVVVVDSNSVPPTYIRTKLGVILALLVRADFPSQWPTAFHDLTTALVVEPATNNNNVTAITGTATTTVSIVKEDVFLRALHAMGDEIFDTTSGEQQEQQQQQQQQQRSIMMHIKDVMRGFETNNGGAVVGEATAHKQPYMLPVEQTISSHILETVFTMLVKYRTRVLATNGGSTTTSRNSNTGGSGGQNSNNSNNISSISDISMCALCLSVVKRFVSWVDYSLIAKENVMSLLCSNLAFGNAHAHASSGNEYEYVKLAIETVQCLCELVGRGMEEYKKIQLLVSVNLLQRIHDSGIDFQTVDATHIDVVIKAAELINMTGIELLMSWDAVCSDCRGEQNDGCNFKVDTDNQNAGDTDAAMAKTAMEPLLQQLMVLFFKCFSYDDIDVSGAVIPLASRLTIACGDEMDQKGSQQAHGIGSTKSNTFAALEHLPQLMTVMYHQMRYPPDYEFDYQDEDEAEEEVYRTDLRKLNQRVVRIAPELSLQFLCTALANLPMPLSTAPTGDIEVALRLLYHYCEGIRPPPGMKTVMKNETFRNVLVALHSSDVAAHPHREVLLLYYDIAVRYHSILKDKLELLPVVLESISGARGLQHSHPRVRSRSCYLLLRLVKSIPEVMGSFVETAVGGIQGLLTKLSTYPLEPDDSLYLFETIGILLGKTGLDTAKQASHLTAVMAPHVLSIEERLRSTEMQTNPEQVGPNLAASIAAIAYLSKGFTKPSPQVQSVLLDTVRVTLAVLEAFPGNDVVRNKCLILLQRMIQTLGTEILPSVPRLLQLLIPNCAMEDIVDVAQLFQQLCIKFKKDAACAIDAALLPFLRACHELMPGNDVASSSEGGIIPPHLLTEQLSIKKLSFVVLQVIATQRASAVLLSPTNAGAIEDILSTMNEGATMVPDPVMRKTCATFFRELVDQWASEDSMCSSSSNSPSASEKVQHGFLAFVYMIYVPGMLKSFLEPNFNPRDAMQARCIGEFTSLLSIIKRKRGPEEFEHQIIGQSLQKLPCPLELINSIRIASKPQEMERSVKQLITGCRQTYGHR